MYALLPLFRSVARAIPMLALLALFASPVLAPAMEHKDQDSPSAGKKMEKKSKGHPTTQPSAKKSAKGCPCSEMMRKKHDDEHDGGKGKRAKHDKKSYKDRDKDDKAHHWLKMMAHMKKRDDDRRKKKDHDDLDDMLGEAPRSLKKHQKKKKDYGVPHLYHIAAEYFLFDRKDKLDFSDEQKRSLKQIVEDVHLTLATHHRKIKQAEQELWVLTGKNKPDASSVEAKMKEIAELKVAKRMAYFKAVEKAVGVLTDEQKQKLLE